MANMERQLTPSEAFWRGRRVFITGHTGFKGSWLTQWLIRLGAVVKGYSLPPPTKPALFEVLKLEEKVEHCLGDIRDCSRLEAALLTFRPEFVFHLAAQPLVRQSYLQPRETYETNVMGTVHLYEAVRKSESIRVVVTVTTDKCYENREWIYGYRESDPMGGYDPYSSSKGCAELVTNAYRASFFNPADFGTGHKVSIATARAGNVMGGGDWAADRLIPDCIRSLSKGEEIRVRNPLAVRPWQHVLEPISGYLALAASLSLEPGRFDGAWNFGPGEDDLAAVEEVVKECIDGWGEGSYVVKPESGLHEAQLLKLDISKARSLLGWHPVFNVSEAVVETVGWYKAYYKGNRDMISFTNLGIDTYSRQGTLA